MPSSVPMPVILLTGKPGVGKTTLISKIVAQLRALPGAGIALHGFLTDEVRDSFGKRCAFELVDVRSGRRCELARVHDGHRDGNDSKYVGRYRVNFPAFESVAVGSLDPERSGRAGERTVCIVDEIGKMEILSDRFVQRMEVLFAPTAETAGLQFTLASVSESGGGLIAKCKQLEGVELITVTRETREGLVTSLADCISSWFTQGSLVRQPAAWAKVHRSALCIIPPTCSWAPIQRIRRLHDKGFSRWPPHINVLYPYATVCDALF